MDRLKKYNQQLNIMTYILEDEEDVLHLLEDVFKEHGFENCKFFTRGADLMGELSANVHVCILDFRLSENLTGIDVLKKVKEVNKEAYVIGMSGMTDRNIIIDFVNAGLEKYVDKNRPNYLDLLVQYVRGAIEKIKDDFDWHASLLRKIECYEAKLL